MKLIFMPRITSRNAFRLLGLLNRELHEDTCESIRIVVNGGVSNVKDLKRLLSAIKDKAALAFLSSNLDDTFIVKAFSGYGEPIDGHILYLGENVYLIGVGGREPLTNISSLMSEASNHISKEALLVLVSYYPPRGLCDEGLLPGIRHGLHEVRELLDALKPKLAVFNNCKCPTLIHTFSQGWLACLSQRHACIIVSHVGSSVGGIAARVECEGVI